MTQAAQLAQYGSNTVGLAFKNRIINGAMMIDQRNAGASVTVDNSAVKYPLDRFFCYGSQAASKFTAQQVSVTVTGFTTALKATSSSAYSIVSSDNFYICQNVEGYNIADLGWGAAGASSVTLSFKVYSSLTGTFGGALVNDGYALSYPFSYSIPVANTWTTISITISGPTSGTWLTNNGVGIRVYFSLGTGSTGSSTAGSWQAGAYYSATGATSVVGTNGATFYITGVQLEVGSTATSFDYRPYGTELALCQRYYQKLTAGTSSYAVYGSGYTDSTTVAYYYVKYTTSMRATPTANFSTLQVDSSGFAGTVTSISNLQAGLDSAQVAVTCSGGGLTAARPSNLRSANSTSGFIDFAAEL